MGVKITLCSFKRREENNTTLTVYCMLNDNLTHQTYSQCVHSLSGVEVHSCPKRNFYSCPRQTSSSANTKQRREKTFVTTTVITLKTWFVFNMTNDNIRLVRLDDFFYKYSHNSSLMNTWIFKEP